jgi:two-component system, LytTR family, sensor kinase
VPSLILQPLVENAVKHGIGGRESGGRIELHSWCEGERLHISVRDDGPGFPVPGGDGSADAAGGIGLRNTRERLQSLYGDAHYFSLKPAEGGGVVAHLVLPYHTNADLYTTVVSD